MGESGPFHDLTVAEVVRETPEAISFVLTPPPDRCELFRYEAGQFLTFRLTIDGRTHLRCYSISSAPGDSEPLKVTVKRVQGGVASNWLIDRVKVGDRLPARPPAGRFLLTPRNGPLLMFAGGSGITPVLSLIKAALARTERPVRLLYANRDRRSVIFDAELRVLESRWPERLRILHHLDEEGGHVRAEEIAAIVDREPVADCYVCGPAPFMALVEQVLEDRRVPADRIHIERFVSSGDPTAPPEPSGAPHFADAGEVPERISILLDGQTHSIAYRSGETVLAAALGSGLPVPWSCSQGYCGACIARLTEGGAAMDNNDVLSEDEVDEGFILICQARPVGSRVSIRIEG